MLLTVEGSGGVSYKTCAPSLPLIYISVLSFTFVLLPQTLHIPAVFSYLNPQHVPETNPTMADANPAPPTTGPPPPNINLQPNVRSRSKTTSRERSRVRDPSPPTSKSRTLGFSGSASGGAYVQANMPTYGSGAGGDVQGHYSPVSPVTPNPPAGYGELMRCEALFGV